MEKDHKICLVLKDLPVGGVEEVFFSLAQELVVNNYDVNLVILKNEYSLEMLNRFKDLGLNVQIISNLNLFYRSIKLTSIINSLFSPGFKGKVGVISAKETANFICAFSKIFSYLLGKSKKIEFIVTRHVSVNPNISKNDASNITKYFYKFYKLLNLKVVSCSKGLSEEIAEFCNVKCITVYNPIISETFKLKVKNSLKANNHHFFNNREDTLKICFVGRLAFQKGLDLLFQALEQVNRPFQLVVAGDGDQRKLLQSKINSVESFKNNKDTIVFLGTVSEPFALIKESDLLIMPSRWEGLPTILIEALYLKKCVLASDCNFGPREIIHKSLQHSLFEVNNVSELAKKIEMFESYVIEDAIHNSMMSKFSQKMSTQKYLKILFE